MTPEDLQKIIGILPDVNTDAVIEERIGKDISEMYSLIRSGRVYNKYTNLSKTFVLAEKLKELQEKKDNGTLTIREEKYYNKLRKALGGNR